MFRWLALLGGLALCAPLAGQPAAEAAEPGSSTGDQAGGAGKGGKSAKGGKAGARGKERKAGKLGKTGKVGKAAAARKGKGEEGKSAKGGKGKGRKKGDRKNTVVTRPTPIVPLPGAQSLMNQNMWNAALEKINVAIQSDPDNADLFAMRAICRASTGHFDDAEGDFLLSEGSPYYEQSAIPWHALTLRALGYGVEAGELRLSFMNAEDEGEPEVVQYISAAEDFASGGNYERAFEVIEDGMSAFPNSGAMMAAYAEVLIGMGSYEEAESWIWLYSRRGDTRVRDTMAEARLYLAQGYPVTAEEIVLTQRKAMLNSWPLTALYGEVLLALGSYEEANIAVNRLRWKNSLRPELLRVEILSGAGMQDKDIAQEACTLGATIYANNRQIRESVTLYEQKTGVTCNPGYIPWSLHR